MHFQTGGLLAIVGCSRKIFLTMTLFNFHKVEFLYLLNSGKKDNSYSKCFLQKQRLTGYAYCLSFDFSFFNSQS